MLLLTFTVVNLAPHPERLENDVFTVGGIAQIPTAPCGVWTGSRSRASGQAL